MTELIDKLVDAVIYAIGAKAAHDKIEERRLILEARAADDAKAHAAFDDKAPDTERAKT